jgi:hypothetical protein
MYWALTGYLTGFVAALFLHSFLVGALMADRLYAVPFLILFILLTAAEVETWFWGRWKHVIQRRRRDGLLSRSFCAGVGAAAGFLIYPVTAALWSLLEEKALVVAFLLIGLCLSAALTSAWYLLTRFPKANDNL